MKRIFNTPLFLSFLTGLLLVVSFPFTGSLTPFVFIAWVPQLQVALHYKEKKRGWLSFFGTSCLSMLLFNVGTTWWIWNSTEGGAIMAFLINSLHMAFFLTFGFIAFKPLKKPLFLVGIGLSWLVFEYLNFHWELSWPWLTMGNYFSIRASWVQWYEFTGALGGSLWVIAVNILLLLILNTKKAWGYGIAFLTLLDFPWLLSIALQPSHKLEHTTPQNVVVFQPNIDPYKEKFNTDPHQQLRNMVSMVKPHLKPNSLVVGPETAIQEVFDESQFTKSKSHLLLKDAFYPLNNTVLIGASTYKMFDHKHSPVSEELFKGKFIEYYNTTLFFKEKNQEFIHKSKLVPGTEKIPFITWVPFIKTLTIVNGGTNSSLGVEETPKVFKDNQKIYAPIVCYESIYGEFVGQQCKKGAQLLVVMTNDGWWGDTPGHRQHNSFSALRALENRKYLVRSGNTGISSVWAPDGTCTKSLAYGMKGVISVNVPLITGTTFYTKHGDYLGWLSAIGLLLTLLYSVYTRFATRKSKTIA
jgi:apolipoprotein N-acyltransferase